MHVSQAKVTSYPTLGPLVCRVILWTLFFLMYGVQLPNLLVIIVTMFGYIC
jgi:hypothetical protein